MVPTETSRIPQQAAPHSMESRVCRQLMSQAGLSFSSLVVRRIPNGVCLEGILITDAPQEDVAAAARSVDGVIDVQNHLLVSQTEQPV